MTRSADDLAALRGLDPVDGPGLASTWTTSPRTATRRTWPGGARLLESALPGHYAAEGWQGAAHSLSVLS